MSDKKMTASDGLAFAKFLQDSTINLMKALLLATQQAAAAMRAGNSRIKNSDQFTVAYVAAQATATAIKSFHPELHAYLSTPEVAAIVALNATNLALQMAETNKELVLNKKTADKCDA